jgi:predicted component of type VI protein secretion system
MELARKLAREMDAHRTVSVSRVYVPNEFTVWLSSEDRERYEGVEGEVIGELCAYLLEHARREDLILTAAPHVSFQTDERLSLGEFGIQARLVRGDGHSESAHEPPEEHGQTMIYSTSARVRGPVEQAQHRPPRALLAVEGRRVLLPPTGGTIGRSRDCDVVVEDAGISRQHARLRPASDGWEIEDLGSTNGVLLNGVQLHGTQLLVAGDRLELGSTEMVFELG